MNSIGRHFLAYLCIVGMLWTSTANAQTVKIGILAFRPKPETLQQWSPLAKQLKRAMPQHDFIIEAYHYPELEKAVSDKQVDFVLTNPAHFILLSRRLGVSAPLATLIVMDNGMPLSSFGGVIFTLAERTDLQQLSDLKHKQLVVPDMGSFGGYQTQAYELALAGTKLPDDAVIRIVGMPHDNVVKSVLNGSGDAGFVRTGVLEAMAREGKLELSQIRVLNQKHIDNFPLLLSTRLYPEWPFAALPHADQNIARRVAAVLFELEDDHAVARSMGIHGFSTPSDYSPVEELLRELRLPPFDSTPKFTPHDVWTRYYWQSMSAVTASLIILLLSTRLLLTNRRLKTKRLKLENEVRFRNGLLDALGEGVYGVDADGKCSFINPAALKMLGFAEDEVISSDQHAMFHHHRPDGTTYPTRNCPIYLSLADGKTRSNEDWFWRKDGTGFAVDMTVSPNVIAEGSKGAVVVFRDITERKLNDEHIRHLAQHDTLTDLPNRAMLNDRLHQALAYAKRDNQSVALLFIDLDRFKPVNDTFGHVVGDWLLKQVSIRITGCVRESDTVARVGGDEFVVLLRIINSLDDAVTVAEDIRSALNQPFNLAQQSLEISCCVGIALYPQHAANETEMMEFADIAMYQAKQAGRNRVSVSEHTNNSSPVSGTHPCPKPSQ